MKIKIGSSFTGVVPRGAFENEKPGFFAELEFDYQGVEEQSLIKKCIDENQKFLHEICLGNFKAREQQAIVDRITKERENVRVFVCEKCGKTHASVSSVAGWDSDFHVSPEELSQYASHGNLYDLQAKHFITTSQWLPVEKIDGSYADLVIVKKGSLKLEVNDWDFPEFLKKFKIENMEVGKRLVSCKHGIGGTSDIRKCIYEGKKTLADFKRTADKAKNFCQMAGYIILEEENGESDYEQMMIIPCNGSKNERGFQKPIVTDEISQFKQMFISQRENFRKRFQV